MCWQAAAAGLQVVGAVTQQLSLEAQVAAQQQAAAQQRMNTITSMNYAFQNYEIERQDAFDQAVQKIEKERLNSMQLSASVKAAINEDYSGGGRSAGLLARAAEQDGLRNVSAIKSNYAQKSNEIDINKEATLIGAKQQVNAIKAPDMPSRLGMFINMGSAVAGYGSSMDKANADKVSKGITVKTVKGVKNDYGNYYG